MFSPTEPESRSWHLQALSRRFRDTVHVFESEYGGRSSRSWWRVLLSAGDVLREARRAELICTYVRKYLILMTVFRLAGLVSTPVSFHWGGQDVDIEALEHRPWRRWLFRQLFLSCASVQFMSAHERNEWAKLFPDLAPRFNFLPRCVDYGFYEAFVSPLAKSTRPVFVAVGNDRMRDWDIISRLADLGHRFAVLTHNKDIAAQFEGVEGVEVLQGRSNKESAEIMVECRGIVLATRDNNRFSGSTTVGMAAALTTPLILDEDLELESYGLRPGVNCLYFPRGDERAVSAHLRDLENDPDLAVRLGSSLRATSTVPSTEESAARIFEWTRPARDRHARR